MSPSVSVKNFRDTDAVYAYAHVNESKMASFFSVTEADVQPGVVFLTHNPLLDGIKWGMAPNMLVGRNSI